MTASIFQRQIERFRRFPFGSTLAVVVAATACLGLAVEPAAAQSNPLRRLDRELFKEAPSLMKLGATVAETASDATVQVFVGDRLADLGTVVRRDGFVLTKASELGEGFAVELPDGRRVGGRIVGVAREHDLALLKVDADGLTPANFDASAVDEATSGSWLFTPNSGRRDVLAIGNLSVKGLRRIPSSGGLLGVGLGQDAAGIPVYRVDPNGAADAAGLLAGDLILKLDGAPVGTMQDLVRTLRNGPPDAAYELTLSRGGETKLARVRLVRGQLGVVLAMQAEGVVVSQVAPNSGAEAAGLRVGDIITDVDGTPVRDGVGLVNAVKRVTPGDDAEITFLRNGEEQAVVATIGYRSNRGPRGDLQNNLGTTLSERAVDFPAVIQHDSVLNADQMGGPLVDVKGRVVGINIARAGRVETYALPAQVILGVLPELMSGKLPTATQPATDEGSKPQPQQPLRED